MKHTQPFTLCVIIALVVSACTGVSSIVLNSFETTEFQVDGTVLYMDGTINSKTLAQFEHIYTQNPQIKTLVELDVPGSLDDDTMIALAYRVRKLGLNTHLTAKSSVYSGGVDLFLAGVNRSMEQGAKIGVHSWSDGKLQAQDYPKDSPEHEQNRKYIADMLGDDAFYWFTIRAAPADAIHEMTDQEIKRYKLLTE